MKYTVRGESRVANIAGDEAECYVCHEGEAKCYICHETLIKSCIVSYKQSDSALSVLLYFTLKYVLTEDFPLKFNKFNEYNKCVSLIKMCSVVEPEFYNYPTTVL